MVLRRVCALRPIKRTLHATLQVAMTFCLLTKLSLRRVSSMFNVSKSKLQRALKDKIQFDDSYRTVNVTSSVEEEQILIDTVANFSMQEIPLSRERLKDVVQLFVGHMPSSQQKRILFRNNHPGDRFDRNYINRNPKVALKRRSNLEKQRAIAMCPETVAEDFARLRQAYN